MLKFELARNVIFSRSDGRLARPGRLSRLGKPALDYRLVRQPRDHLDTVEMGVADHHRNSANSETRCRRTTGLTDTKVFVDVRTSAAFVSRVLDDGQQFLLGMPKPFLSGRLVGQQCWQRASDGQT